MSIFHSFMTIFLNKFGGDQFLFVQLVNSSGQNTAIRKSGSFNNRSDDNVLVVCAVTDALLFKCTADVFY